MVRYSVYYTIKNKDGYYNKAIDAKDLKSAKNKIGKKYGYKDGRMIQVQKYSIIGYY